jgi:hypothetical protein
MEEAAVETSGVLKKRYRDDGGSRNKLAVPRKGIIRRVFLHRARDTVVRNQARVILYNEPGKDGRSGRDVWRNRNAKMA